MIIELSSIEKIELCEYLIKIFEDRPALGGHFGICHYIKIWVSRMRKYNMVYICAIIRFFPEIRIIENERTTELSHAHWFHTNTERVVILRELLIQLKTQTRK